MIRRYIEIDIDSFMNQFNPASHKHVNSRIPKIRSSYLVLFYRYTFLYLRKDQNYNANSFKPESAEGSFKTSFGPILADS